MTKDLAIYEKEAIEQVEQRFGSVDQFAAELLETCPGVLDQEVSVTVASSDLGIRPEVLNKILKSRQFQNLLDTIAASQAYSFSKRRKTMDILSHIATSGHKSVMTRAGDIKEVDRDVKENIQADGYLRKLQGRDLERSTPGGAGGITIVFGERDGEGDVNQEVKITSDGVEASSQYRPNKAGQLPPTGARQHYNRVANGEGDGPFGGSGGDFDFETPPGTGKTPLASFDEAKAIGRGSKNRK